MEIAFEIGAEWVWLNDQDGCPDDDCLEMLLKTAMKKETKGIVAPTVYSETKDKVQFVRQIGLFGKSIPFKKFDDIKRIDATGTAGMLIHRDVIQKIGVYNNQACFVGNEDIEFCRRARKHNISIDYSREARYFHPDLLLKRNVKDTSLPKVLHRFMPFYLGSVVEDNLRYYMLCVSSAFLNEKYNSRFANVINSTYSKIRALIKHRKTKYLYKRTIEAYKKGVQLAKTLNNDVYVMENYKNELEEKIVGS
jgi:GT2 family glycosyltransferase